MNDSEFLYLSQYLKGNFGINLEKKRVLLEGRLSNYLLKRGFQSFTEYIDALQADAAGWELSNLLDRVTTNHTYFFREADHFHYLREQILPRLERRVKDRDLRIWCAGCASGEESYTLAMLLEDYFGRKYPAWDRRLLATDLSMGVLRKAMEGVYPQEATDPLPSKWKNLYFFSDSDGRVRISGEIKKQVIHRQGNLMEPISCKKPFHVIFCRNVMIYFDPPTKADLARRLADVLVPGGYLFVGHTEAIAPTNGLAYLAPSIYVKESRNDAVPKD